VRACGPARAPLQVRRAARPCAIALAALETARSRCASAQRTYARAKEARDALLENWTIALARLQRGAHDLLGDDAAQIFAPLEDGTSRAIEIRPVLPNVMNGVHTS
jgi:hypothetical protein